MASQLHWPNKYFFYPLGNTPAISLTRDIPPRLPASFLLLGCGDPRNVLYTVLCDRQVSRKLDFTCCDWDLGVLARNALQLSLILDDGPQDLLWNIFYHTYLDQDSKDLLVSQCRRLIALAKTPQTWRASSYFGVIRFSTDHTLAEVCRFWQSYVDMYELPDVRYEALTTKFRVHCQTVVEENSGIMFSRGAGPMGPRAAETMTAVFKQFWKSGVSAGTSTSKATFLNPTFIYSRGEEATSLHYGQCPITPFHLAPAFDGGKSSPTVAQVVRLAKDQFATWCTAFRVASAGEHAPVVRLIWGDALAVSSSLRAFAETGRSEPGFLYAQWSAKPIRFDSLDYAKGDAPTTFDVIDTSNLNDHLGLLNLLIVAEPLLASCHSVLYTEALTAAAGTDAEEYALKLLRTDFPTLALLLNLCPADYLSGFTTRSNVDEVVFLNTFRDEFGDNRQFQQGLTWRRPTSGDMLSGHSLAVFDDRQFASLFYALYRELFDRNELGPIGERMLKNPREVLKNTQETQYTRETFSLLVKVICDKHRLDANRRTQTLQAFLKLLHDSFNPMSTAGLHMQELYMHLFRLGLCAVDIFHIESPRIGRFASWDHVPDLARVILVVPRAKLKVFENTGKTGNANPFDTLAAAAASTPPVHGLLLTKSNINVFASIHVVFGTATPTGNPTRPGLTIREDPRGWLGEDPLLVSFIVSTKHLTILNKPEDVAVAFAVRMTSITAFLSPKLGQALVVHQAPLMDGTQVHVLPVTSSVDPTAGQHHYPTHSSTSSRSPPPQSCPNLGTSSVFVQLNEESDRVKKLVGRVSVDERNAKLAFQTAGANPIISQSSPCTVRISLAGRTQDVLFPYPVVVHNHKLRIARKSCYVEVVLALSGGLQRDGMAICRFPVVHSQSQGSTYPWNVHRVNLSDLPRIDIPKPSAPLVSWLRPHVSLAMSAREMSLRERSGNDVLMFIKDTIHALFSHVAGAEQNTPHRVFQLLDESSQNFSDTVLFVDSLRHDLGSATVVCHAYVLPLTRELAPRIHNALMRAPEGRGIMNIKIYPGEGEVWKRLFPAFAERCRTWEHTANCEYVAVGRIPLSTEKAQDPLCSCGRGKDVEGSMMLTRPALRELAPHVTRIAISPIFSVSYLEPLRDFSSLSSMTEKVIAGKCGRCSRTSGKDSGNLKTCSKCHVMKYCSAECQRADWKSHKLLCQLVWSKE
ncbi:unnamed protein product [Peniophora sp. CBMAI 1063]|nr:unnamed protein product [Peniophora sp. CBMAI 1063]